MFQNLHILGKYPVLDKGCVGYSHTDNGKDQEFPLNENLINDQIYEYPYSDTMEAKPDGSR